MKTFIFYIKIFIFSLKYSRLHKFLVKVIHSKFHLENLLGMLILKREFILKLFFVSHLFGVLGNVFIE